MGFLGNLLDLAQHAKIIATRDLTNGSVNIVDIENDSVSEITVDVVREGIRLFNEELEKFYTDSVPYKHVSIDKDEMVKLILKSLGDKKYVQKLLNEID
jgi:hypothetical protein